MDLSLSLSLSLFMVHDRRTQSWRLMHTYGDATRAKLQTFKWSARKIWDWWVVSSLFLVHLFRLHSFSGFYLFWVSTATLSQNCVFLAMGFCPPPISCRKIISQACSTPTWRSASTQSRSSWMWRVSYCQLWIGIRPNWMQPKPTSPCFKAWQG